VSDYLLAVQASPNPALPGGARVLLEATLTSPAGRPLANRPIRFSATGDGILLGANAMTDANGLAKTVLLTGSAFTPHLIRAEHSTLFTTIVGETNLVVEPPQRDVAINVLDISFHRMDGSEIIPGDVDPLRAGERVELRANVRNLGKEPTPPLEVLFRHSVVTLNPPTRGAPVVIDSAWTGSIPANGVGLASLQTTFSEEGFHILDVLVDPNNAFQEFTKSNNQASQGFWVGEFYSVAEGDVGADGEVTQPPPSPVGLTLTCELTGGPVSPTGVLGVGPGDTLELSGRADYTDLIAVDPDRSLGLAAVRGGIVDLELLDASGNSVTLSNGPNTIMPASGQDPSFGALVTLASAADMRDVGQYPSRSADDVWSFAAPTATGCYKLRTCVSDGAQNTCCDKEFCVEPEGPRLSCDRPATPISNSSRTPPRVGEATTLTTTVTNSGDYDTATVTARLLVDGSQVGEVKSLSTLSALESELVSFPWTPSCGSQRATVELSWTSAFPGQTQVRTANCATQLPDIATASLSVSDVNACDYELVARKTLSQAGLIPARETAVEFAVTKPDMTSVRVAGSVDLTTSTGAFRFDKPGTYSVKAIVDGPLEAGVCGEAPERDEAGNNVISRDFCADPSPSDTPRGGSTASLVIDPWPVIYGEPATVRARIHNHGSLPVNAPLDTLLTSSRGPILDTDKPADTVRIEASCDAPLMPGESRELTWLWTPRYPTDGTPELRDIRVLADTGKLYPACDQGTPNDLIELKYGMNLYAQMQTSQVMQLGAPMDFQVDVLHSGGIRPNNEGSLLRFEIFKDGGSRLRQSDQVIVAPGGPTNPDRHQFTWTPSAVDCDATLPLKYVRTEVDQNGKYLETNETDNEKRLNLPDLVPTALTQSTQGCESELALTVEDLAPSPSIAAGTWSGRITVTGPDGSVTTIPLTNMRGAGTFQVSDLTGVRFPASVAGNYRYSVEIDTSSSSTCGEILESNERNNRLDGSWNLCPDPAFEAGSLVATQRVQRGRETEFVATLRNKGRLSIVRNIPVRLGTRDGNLINLAEPIANVSASCDAPIEPNGTYNVRWRTVLSPLDPVDILVATIDPNDFMPEECRGDNNQTSRFMYLDVSPWTSWQNANFNTLRDIATSNGERLRWGSVASASYAVRTHPPRPGASNARRERITSPMRIYPGIGEMTISHLFERLRGPDEVFGTQLLDAVAENYPVTNPRYPLPIDFSQASCNPDDPIVAVGVRIDRERRVLESNEDNQYTSRPLPNLDVAEIRRSPVLNDRFLLSYQMKRSNFKEFYIGSWAASGELTLPTGAVVPIPLASQTGPVMTCQGCQATGSAAEPIEHPGGIDVPLNGFYALKVTADPPRADAPCGDIPERDERDNSETVRWALCPELSVSVTATPPAPTAPGVASTDPWQVEVRVRNKGTRALVEDLEVRLGGLDPNDLPLEAAVTPAVQTASFDRDDPLEVGEVAPLQFEWNSYAPGPELDKLVAYVKVLDTDAANGGLDFALCSTKQGGGFEREGSTPVCARCFGTCLDCEPPPADPPETGCEISIDPTPLSACGSTSLSFRATRPGSGDPIAEDEVAPPLDAVTLSFDPQGYIDPLEPEFTYEGPGDWSADIELPQEMLGASLSLFVTMTLNDGSTCYAQQAYLVDGGNPDIKIDADNIEFTSLNGDGLPYTDALVGDAAEMRLSVTNGPSSCGASNLTGYAYIDLDFSQIPMGSWLMPSIGGDETLPVNLAPELPPGEGDGTFIWEVTAPSPWTHIVTLVVDQPGGTPLVATKVLNVGRFPPPGDPPALPVTLVDPTPGPLAPSELQPFTFLVERTTPGGTDPVLPEQLLQLEAIVSDSAGQVLATYDMLAQPDDHLGGGEFVANFDTSVLGVDAFAITARARLVGGLTGIGSGDFTLEATCERPEACVVCYDDDGDGFAGLSESCPDGTDCDDDDSKGTTLDEDGDCDDSLTDEDCDDTDASIAGPCPIDCDTTPGIDVSLAEVRVTAPNCFEDSPQLEITLVNVGDLPIGPDLALSYFRTEPALDASPVMTVAAGDLVLLDGEFPLEPGLSVTLLHTPRGPLAALLTGDIWVVGNHTATTPFAVREGVTMTSGAVAECVVDDNQAGPLACESTETECEEDADCGFAADVCDTRRCDRGFCVDEDDGTTWSMCEDSDVFYVRVMRGDEVGYVTCRLRGNGLEGSECDLDEDGKLLVSPPPADLYCDEEDGR
jgi:hypothetical protein